MGIIQHKLYGIRLYVSLVVSYLIFFNSEVYGRFDHDDSLEMDSVENKTPEFYNDLISYRYPRTWDIAWKNASSGIRTSAGSLDIRRFSFFQDLKLTSSPQESLVFGFRSEREESPVFQKNLQELRVTKQFKSIFEEITLLGDCGFEKEYGDLGLEVKSLYFDDFRVLYRYWAVDLYYNSKKEEGEDYRSRQPQSHEIRLLWGEDLSYSAEIFAKIDTPVDWQRLSKGYRYRSQERIYGVRLTRKGGFFSPPMTLSSNQDGSRGLYQKPFEKPSPDQVEILVLGEQKTEQVDLLEGTNASGLSTRFLRPPRLFSLYWRALGGAREGVFGRQKVERSLLEIGLDQAALEGDRFQGGLMILSEKTSRLYDGPPDALAEVLKVDPDEGKKKSTLDWDESSLYGSYVRRDRNQSGSFWHHGFALNQQINNHLSNRRSIELKYIAALELNLSEGARFFLNSTWDLDQLTHDAPFDKRSFRPWGGGNLQGIFVF